MGRRSHNETIVVDSTTIDYARIPSRNTDTLADRRAGMSARGFAVNASLLFRVPAAPEANVVAVRLRRKGLGDLPLHINMRMPRLATAHGRCTPATAVPCLNLDNNNNNKNKNNNNNTIKLPKNKPNNKHDKQLMFLLNQ